MVFIHLKDGSEVLLVGDVVWNSLSITHLTGRPILASLTLHEDRGIHLNLVRTLHALA